MKIKLIKSRFFILSLLLLLAAWGDLRNIIEPAGYWIVWLLGVGLILIFHKSRINYSLLILFIIISCSALLSALFNVDQNTLYQSIKILVCGFCLIIVVGFFKNITFNEFTQAVRVVLSVTIIAYFLSKAVFKDWLVVLGDAREGVVFSYPGVIWKIGLFAFVVSLVRLFYLFNYKDCIFVLLSFYLVLIDGSRTGILLIGISFFAINFFLLRNNRKYLFFIIALVSFSALFISKLFSFEILALNRISEGDETRIRMFKSGLEYIERCWASGCGFGFASIHDNSLPGGEMVIHNAYIAALVDFGIFALLAFLIVIFGWWGQILLKPLSILSVISFIGVLNFSILMMFHPFSTEMSEWAWLAFAFGVMNIKESNLKC